MASLDDIVSVSIALQTTGVTRGDFGTPMIVAPLMTFPERVRVYTSYAAAAEDDLPPNLLTALSDCFGQTPRTPSSQGRSSCSAEGCGGSCVPDCSGHLFHQS